MVDEFLKKDASFIRLLNEYKKHGSLTIGYDFDGTVHDYHKTGATYLLVRQLLRELKNDLGCKLICWTAYEDLSYVKNFLIENDIPFDGINEGGIQLPWKSDKPFFSTLLDDRAGLIQVYNELSLLLTTIKKENENKSISTN